MGFAKYRSHLSALSALVAITAFLPGCATVQHGTADRLLTPPKGYQFLPDKAMAAAEEAGVSNAPYWHGQVEKAISAELAKKGFTVSGTAPDLVVAFHVITQRGKKTTFLDNYSGYKLSAKEQAEQPEIANYLSTPGSANRSILIIDVIDPEKREVVWRDWTQAPNKGRRDAQKTERAIEHAVRTILSKFPPKG